MDEKKVLEAISIYRSSFEKYGIHQIDFCHHQEVNIFEDVDGVLNVLAHCHGMLDQMEKFVAEGRMEKVFRWLGFVQGCLWTTGQYSLEELKKHNRPDPAD